MKISRSFLVAACMTAAGVLAPAAGALAESIRNSGGGDQPVLIASEAENVLYANDTWQRKSRKVSGQWQIIETSDGNRFLELGDDFRTSGAPDLKIYLSELSADEVANDTAEPSGTLIAPLESTRGAQRYEIPADLDLSGFQSVLIHCRQFTKLWAASALLPAGQPS